MLNKEKLLSTLGMCQRARKLVYGDELSNQISNGSVVLVVLATDASDRTKKQFKDKCEFYKVPLLETVSRTELSQAIGAANRVCVGVTDRGFAALINSYFEKEVA